VIFGLFGVSTFYIRTRVLTFAAEDYTKTANQKILKFNEEYKESGEPLQKFPATLQTICAAAH